MQSGLRAFQVCKSDRFFLHVFITLVSVALESLLHLTRLSDNHFEVFFVRHLFASCEIVQLSVRAEFLSFRVCSSLNLSWLVLVGFRILFGI